MKIIAIVQSRMGSTRLPGKALLKINEKSVISLLLNRLSKSKKIDKIVVATTSNPEDNCLEEHIKNLGFTCFRGSETNVLERYYKVAHENFADIVIRITGDCPFIDCHLVDDAVDFFLKNKVDYISNSSKPTLPDGLDVEVFSMRTLEETHRKAISDYDKEHVTPYIRNSGNFNVKSLTYELDYSDRRWTLDEQDDFDVVNAVYDHFHPNIYFSWKKILKLQDEKPYIFKKNSNIKRNEGAIMGKGQKLYKRAKQIIPGGNMLLSKRPEMFLPEKWPAYFSKASGCKVWDLDNKEYIDMSIMGIGTNILGYGNKEVDAAVLKTVKNGNMSTLNCPEEVHLAEKLIDMHPWAEMARFARSGGEANAVAIRIARAFSGKDNVAICGYHGWHDWYLSANLSSDENLQEHLLPGLNPSGVPKDLEGTVYPFNFNDYDSLEKIVETKDIGIIKMEVQRNDPPKDNFLEKVRKLSTKNGIILIFDECTSGFRETFGGIHKKFNVNPDMAMFGKALGNGYGITAVLGKKEIMEAAQNTFISSTFWTERVGPSAALKTLEVMKEIESWSTITKQGEKIRNGISILAKEHNLDIAQWGLLPLTGYTFNSKNSLAYKTYITQEMLKKGYLASNSVYVCTEHTDKVIDAYLENLSKVFLDIVRFEDGENVMDKLEGPICHSGFARLN